MAFVKVKFTCIANIQVIQFNYAKFIHRGLKICNLINFVFQLR